MLKMIIQSTMAGENNVFEQLKDEYILEKHRLDSFKFWPFPENSSCSKLKMAEAGFYWSGTKNEPDTATCFICNKTLDGWEETDDPWKEHNKHAPQCIFVKFGNPQNELKLREFLEIFTVIVKKRISRSFDKVTSDLDSEATKELNKFA